MKICIGLLLATLLATSALAVASATVGISVSTPTGFVTLNKITNSGKLYKIDFKTYGYTNDLIITPSLASSDSFFDELAFVSLTCNGVPVEPTYKDNWSIVFEDFKCARVAVSGDYVSRTQAGSVKLFIKKSDFSPHKVRIVYGRILSVTI